jgi:hypothetical protein
MRLRMLFVAAAIGIGMASASPGVSGAQVATQDSVTGGGRIVGASFGVDARSGPSGENPTGTAFVASSVFRLRAEGPVTCLNVTGNRAVVGFANTLGDGFAGVGGFIEVTDGTPDTVTLTRIASGEPPTVCPPPLGIGGSALGTGDIVVVDAPALPTSKDQCKNGGWGQFGFNNRKQCIRSVRQQARRECIYIRAANGRPAFRAQYGSGSHKRHAMRRCIRERMND